MKNWIIAILFFLFTPNAFGKSPVGVTFQIAGGCVVNSIPPGSPILAANSLRTSFCVINNTNTDVRIAFSQNSSMPVNLSAANSFVLKSGSSVCDEQNEYAYIGGVFCQSTTSTGQDIDVSYTGER